MVWSLSALRQDGYQEPLSPGPDPLQMKDGDTLLFTFKFYRDIRHLYLFHFSPNSVLTVLLSLSEPESGSEFYAKVTLQGDQPDRFLVLASVKPLRPLSRKIAEHKATGYRNPVTAQAVREELEELQKQFHPLRQSPEPAERLGAGYRGGEMLMYADFSHTPLYSRSVRIGYD